MSTHLDPYADEDVSRAKSKVDPPPSHEPARRSASPGTPAVPQNRGPGSKFVQSATPDSVLRASLQRPFSENSSFLSRTVNTKPPPSRRNNEKPRKSAMKTGDRRDSHSRKTVRMLEDGAPTVTPSAPFMPQRYIAQGAYTQRNPFRVQNFEEFAANPIYAKPPGFHAYADCKMYNFESARATQGEFLLQRLADATNPMSAEERESTAKFLNSVVDKLQAGEWFFKWSGRKDKVYQRYFWVNLQRGTLMWSFSPDKVSFFNAEVKLLTVTQVVPDCIQDGSTNRTFYRIRVESPEKSVCMSTEIRGKFDVWYRALKDLTASNADSGVPGIWGRPSCSINFTAGGTMSRWASRYSPLQAVVDSANEELGGISVRPNCRVASSD